MKVDRGLMRAARVRAVEMRPAARARFDEWLSRATAADLVGVLLDRQWPDPDRLGATLAWRVEGEDLARVRAAAVAAIEAAGGRVELGATVASVVAGELRISMA